MSLHERWAPLLLIGSVTLLGASRLLPRQAIVLDVNRPSTRMECGNVLAPMIANRSREYSCLRLTSVVARGGRHVQVTTAAGPQHPGVIVDVSSRARSARITAAHVRSPSCPGSIPVTWARAGSTTRE